MSKYTEVELELLTDQNMLCMIMKGIRGGLSCIMKRYVEVNIKYMINYDPTKESSYLVPVDANNVYGVSFKLPDGAFKWCTKKEIEDLEKRILEIPDDNDIGYTLKVKCLEYPKELHDKHNDCLSIPLT
jgi:hypothetical protein